MTDRKTDDIVKSREQEREQKQRKPVGDAVRQGDVKLESLAALHNSLQSGACIMALPEDTLEAAGTLGNQNVLRLIEQGESQRDEIAQTNMNIEAYNLYSALN